MKGLTQATSENLAKTLGVKLTVVKTMICVVENGKEVFSFPNWEQSTAFLLGVCWGEGRSAGRKEPHGS